VHAGTEKIGYYIGKDLLFKQSTLQIPCKVPFNLFIGKKHV
jgi:hypothetical protein